MLLKRHIQSKQIFNYVCQTVIYVAGVPPESQGAGITLVWSGRDVTQQHGVLALVSHLSFLIRNAVEITPYRGQSGQPVPSHTGNLSRRR